MHITQAADRNTFNVNMASPYVLTLNSFVLFKEWNAANVTEMNREIQQHYFFTLNMTSYFECRRYWQCSDYTLINLIPCPDVWHRLWLENMCILVDKPLAHTVQVQWGWKGFLYWTLRTYYAFTYSGLLTMHPHHIIRTLWKSDGFWRGNLMQTILFWNWKS